MPINCRPGVITFTQHSTRQTQSTETEGNWMVNESKTSNTNTRTNLLISTTSRTGYQLQVYQAARPVVHVVVLSLRRLVLTNMNNQENGPMQGDPHLCKGVDDVLLVILGPVDRVLASPADKSQWGASTNRSAVATTKITGTLSRHVAATPYRTSDMTMPWLWMH